MASILIAPRARAAFFALWCLSWAWVAYMSLASITLPSGVSDKTLHFTGYMLMSAGVASFCHDPRRIVLWALAAAAIGGGLEIAQAFTPDRDPEWLDFAADAAGAGLGGLLALAWLGLIVRPLRRTATTTR
jgi:VanZ family protein